VRQATAELSELSEYESRFSEYLEGLESAGALLEDLSFSLRDFADKLEFSPARLAEIDDRLAELSRLKRKYGGTLEAALEHMARSQDRLQQIESSDERERQLKANVATARGLYETRSKTSQERVALRKSLSRPLRKALLKSRWTTRDFKFLCPISFSL
jgi:DNA repair protein RecN (Recombination protein N)